MSTHRAWLFGPRTDAAVFAGSALASGLLAWASPWLTSTGETPLWAWVMFVLAIDVAHVWATLFRTYLDGEELRRRPLLYVGTPLLALAVGIVASLYGPLVFWRLLAYAALAHFIRQQYGWVALYGRRAGTPAWERRLDGAAIYAATLGPAVWWHANLPRPFWWFVEGDFAPLPTWMGTAALAAHAAILAAWCTLQLGRLLAGSGVHPGKVLLVAATWSAWFGGIVLARDDLAFTVMNVTLHGVPYLVLLWRYARGRAAEEGRASTLLRLGLPGFLGFLLVLAFLEELLWDRLVWHERPLLFGEGSVTLADDALALLVPLLALPQATHYLLDAFVWRPGRDARLLTRLGWAHAGEAQP
ncbi:MAG: hypothetical protein L0Y66_03895 [Myxococcaceae bacterium]|nr:hypothetical protein [Myxococcaceae bacterium]MCI0669818.1 hypothetical protein [Myxococcaceae bacterium]